MTGETPSAARGVTEAITEALERVVSREGSILADLRSAHHGRGPGASSEMRADDRDDYEAAEIMFSSAKAALAALSLPAPGEGDVCPDCKGTGGIYPADPCAKCRGSGKISSGELAVKALQDAMRQAMDIYQADAESDIGEAMFMVLHTALSSLDRTTLPTAEGER